MMNPENYGLEKLRDAFKEINEWEYENLGLDEMDDVIPSDRYVKRMERLIKRQKTPYWKYINTAAKRTAVLAIAIALTLTLSMSVSAVREPVVEFFAYVYEKFVEIFFGEDDIAKAPDTIETVYTLEYIPQDYELKERFVHNKQVKTVWENADGEEISLIQYTMEVTGLLDNEDSGFQILYVDGIQVAYAQKNNVKDFVWHFENYAFILALPEAFSDEECLHILSSITDAE